MGELRIELGATLLVQVTQPAQVEDTPPESVDTCPHGLSAHAASTYRPEAHPRGASRVSREGFSMRAHVLWSSLARQNAPSFFHPGRPKEGVYTRRCMHVHFF